MPTADRPPDPAEPTPRRAPYVLLGADRHPYPSSTPGRFGGHRRNRIYGRLDCRAALAAISKGGYVAQRVFFADEPTAVAAGYRPCAACMPAAYRAWKGQFTPTSLAGMTGATATGRTLRVGSDRIIIVVDEPDHTR